MMNIEELRSYVIREVSRTENRSVLLSLFYILLEEEGKSYVAVRTAWLRYYFKQLRLFPDKSYPSLSR